MAFKKVVQSGDVEDAIEKVNDLNLEVSFLSWLQVFEGNSRHFTIFFLNLSTNICKNGYRFFNWSNV